MLAALFVASHHADKELRRDAEENIAFKAKILANTVYWWDQMNVLTLKQLSQQSDVISMDEDKQEAVLKNLVKTHDNLYIASTTDRDGFNLARSDGGKPLYYGDRHWFLGARAGKEITYQTLISRSIRKPAICMGAPIRETPGEVAGVMMMCSELSALAEQIGQLKFGKTGYAVLVDNTGKVLAHPNPAFISGEQLTDSSEYAPIKKVLEGRDGFFAFKDKGIKWVSYGISLDNGWNVAILQQETEFLQNEQEFQRMAYLVSSVAVLAVIGLTLLLANHLIKPISELTTAAKAISNGQLDRRVEIKREDELGSLATSFNQMAKRLKISFKELEHRVRKRTAELNKAKETAENANQTKDRFLARISHELRSPLNSIISYATILQDKPDLMSNQVKGLNVIRESSIHLLNLIEDILDFSKVKVGKIEINPVYLHWQSFLDGIVGMVEMWAKDKQIRFEYEVVGNIATGLWADEKRLRQVLINLLNNAIKFTQEGKVTLKVSVIDETQDVYNVERPISHQKLRFEVIDTGIGISPNNIEKIFQPFEQVSTVENNVHGVGLGLAISNQIISMMGSQIKVKSQVGVGSIFSFDINLPVSEMNSEPTSLPSLEGDTTVPVLSLGDRKYKVLLVDDKEENHLALIRILEPLGFEVISVTNGQQAIEIASSINPDLVLLDLFMPVKTGFTLVRELRQIPKYKTIPLILVSASSYEVVRKASQHLGCEAFLTKPIDENKLLALLKQYGLLSNSATF
ncbi:MAG: ATP-binding protein [Xenococcaceae cyanobacterium MO_188.B19]|nr:ATP-binding protein [Xenococcaceae cyanobacterium MO_188.B19]